MNLNEKSVLLYNSMQAAKALQISERKLWSLTVPRGPLPCVRIGKSVRFDPDDLKDLIGSSKQMVSSKCISVKEKN